MLPDHLTEDRFRQLLPCGPANHVAANVRNSQAVGSVRDQHALF